MKSRCCKKFWKVTGEYLKVETLKMLVCVQRNVFCILEPSLQSTFNWLPLVIAEWWEAAGCLLHFPGVVRQVLTYTAAPQRAGSLLHGSEQVGGGRGSASGGTWQGLSRQHFLIFSLLHLFFFLSHFNCQIKGALLCGNANFAFLHIPHN